MTTIGSFATARRGGVSTAEIEAVQQRLGARATPAQIAKQLGRCEADVRAVMMPAASIAASPATEAVALPARVAATHPRWDEDRRALAHKMLAAGFSSSEIGQAMGCDGSSVRAFFKREKRAEADLLGQKRREEQERRALFTRLWMEGATTDQITERMGWKTTKYVNRWRERLGLPVRRRVSGSLGYAVPMKDAA